MKSAIDNLNNAAPEIRAFIYQQLTDLEGLLPQNSNVFIMVEDPSLLKKSKKKQKMKVIINLETEVGNLAVTGENTNIYKAIQSAKESLKTQLSALQSFLVGEEREQEIHRIMEQRYLH
jgi:ribosome-associated translation inhibitor RaiA